MLLSDSFFGQKFGITEANLQSYLSEAMSAGGDYADLYFEYLSTSTISIDESIVKSATQGVSLGVGVRVHLRASAPATPIATISARRRSAKPPRVAACIAQGPSTSGQRPASRKRASAISIPC